MALQKGFLPQEEKAFSLAAGMLLPVILSKIPQA